MPVPNNWIRQQTIRKRERKKSVLTFNSITFVGFCVSISKGIFVELLKKKSEMKSLFFHIWVFNYGETCLRRAWGARRRWFTLHACLLKHILWCSVVLFNFKKLTTIIQRFIVRTILEMILVIMWNITWYFIRSFVTHSSKKP